MAKHRKRRLFIVLIALLASLQRHRSVVGFVVLPRSAIGVEHAVQRTTALYPRHGSLSEVALRASLDLSAVWMHAATNALRGGSAGLVAGVVQVLCFMWLRTVMHYQYYNGGGFRIALTRLWKEGGFARLYEGVTLALVQAPLIRFGDTAANVGVLVLMNYYFPTLSITWKTFAASAAAGLWRLLLTPIDTVKTARQVRGEAAVTLLRTRIQNNGVLELYSGATANFSATWVGSFPYFVVFNFLSEKWTVPEKAAMRILRNGALGMCSSVTSAVASNAFHVLRTIQQATENPNMSYTNAASTVIKKEGVRGLFLRGLETRMLVNILQGSFFAIVWKLIEEHLMK